MERTWALVNREVQVILPFRYVAIISVILSKIVCIIAILMDEKNGHSRQISDFLLIANYVQPIDYVIVNI